MKDHDKSRGLEKYREGEKTGQRLARGSVVVDAFIVRIVTRVTNAIKYSEAIIPDA